MDKVRIGIIGIGNMGTSHAREIFSKKVKNMELAAVCDTNPERLEWAKNELGDEISCFETDKAFFAANNLYDAVCIATPHYEHPRLAIEAFKLGKHVMVEKPAGVYTKQVAEMNMAAEKAGTVFSIMYNQRANPMYQKVRELVQSGELGKIKRMVWIITDWYRSQSYHDSSTWRSTWSGEGGGVLLNQDPHQLDLWQWIMGMPERIRAFAYFGKYYNIEVDDDVTAYAEYADGKTATFITSTGEAPGTNRLEISGSMGKLVLENNMITFWRNRVDEREFNRTYTGGFGRPECWKCEIPTVVKTGQHMAIFQNFTDCILNGTPLLAPGKEGILGLEISNAIHLSSWTDNWVNLPIDEDLFYEKLQEKIKNSTFQKKQVKAKVLDVGGTH
ncbi:MAG: Gfo/Idh/MocA family oxidoreductase [Clostridia bacterium]|nr:Gfo/Idh/MocA family oxidoreductase [Clostridia bacterium]